ncbi:MAG: hypothetical protein M3N38_00920 [Pseudomonadota bacterium]|nr:hypothetical protein [Pseudomonadota bacterium]
MRYKAIYAYAWDVAEAGVGDAVDQFRGLGLDTVTIAGSYHAGKFLRPHGTKGKVYFPEDGTVYFKTDPRRYGTIKPIANRLLAERDVLRELTEAKRIAVNVWLVLLHNTPLASAHPVSAVANAFGDRYRYSLCPAAPDARAYAIGLARELTSSYPVSGLSLETPGHLPYAHGFHHEFALDAPNRWLDSHLGLCFCEHCINGASQAGIDAGRLKAKVAEDVGSYLASDIAFPADMAEAFWLADTRSNGDLKTFLDWRCTVVTSLVAEIRAAVPAGLNVAVIPSVARPTAGAWYEGSDLAALAGAAGIIEACFYEPGAARVKAELFDVKRRLAGRGKLRAILRPAWPDFSDRGEFLAGVAALAEGGIDGIAFYNWGHLRLANIAWIGEALRLLDKPR